MYTVQLKIISPEHIVICPVKTFAKLIPKLNFGFLIAAKGGRAFNQKKLQLLIQEGHLNTPGIWHAFNMKRGYQVVASKGKS